MLNSSLYPPAKPSEGLPTKPGRSNSSHTAPQHPHACSRKVPSSERARTCQSPPPPPMQAQEPSGQKSGRSHRRSMHAPEPKHALIQNVGVSPVPNRGLQASSPWASDPSGHHDALRALIPPGIIALPQASSPVFPCGGTHPAVLSKKVVRYVVGHDARQVEVDQKEKFETI